MVKKVLLGLLALLLVVTAVLVFNTLQFKSKQLAIEAEPAPELVSPLEVAPVAPVDLW